LCNTNSRERAKTVAVAVESSNQKGSDNQIDDHTINLYENDSDETVRVFESSTALSKRSTTTNTIAITDTNPLSGKKALLKKIVIPLTLVIFAVIIGIEFSSYLEEKKKLQRIENAYNRLIDEGNKYFASGDYIRAIRAFNGALSMDGSRDRDEWARNQKSLAQERMQEQQRQREIEALSQDCGIVSFRYTIGYLNYGTVVSANGRCWLDRNLGAKRVATSPTDSEAFGDLFQWGRAADGHERRNSATIRGHTNRDWPELGSTHVNQARFFLPQNAPYDWRSPQNNNLWQTVNDRNDTNPCPPDYRIPTIQEWNIEVESWNSNISEEAFGSPLKLPLAGFRSYRNGSIFDIGSSGNYWTSSVSGSEANRLLLSNRKSTINSVIRAFGLSVRCIKD
jgi:uncharacterized protein (TIGR02145 family)